MTNVTAAPGGGACRAGTTRQHNKEELQTANVVEQKGLVDLCKINDYRLTVLFTQHAATAPSEVQCDVSTMFTAAGCR